MRHTTTRRSVRKQLDTPRRLASARRQPKAYKLYKYSELEGRAKERAKNWYLDSLADENWWWEDAAEDTVREVNADTGLELEVKDISFSYSGGQGDYARFEFGWTQLNDKMLAITGVDFGDVDLDGVLVNCARYNTVDVDLSAVLTDDSYTDAQVEAAEKATDKFMDKFQDYLDEKGKEFLRRVEDEWLGFVMDEEGVEDVMEGNEYLFTQFGDFAQVGY